MAFDGGPTLTLKPLFVSLGSAPPPTLVPSPARSKPLAPESSGPSAIVYRVAVLPAPGTNSSVAICAPAPEKRKTGVRVPLPESAAPGPLFTDSVYPAALTPVPDIASGTSMISPFTSPRPRLTLNATAPSVTASVRAKLTTVGSLSRM